MNLTCDWRRWVLAGAASTVLLVGGANAQPSTTTPPPPSSETEEDDVEDLEEFVVVGSRIKRIDAETPAPVIQIRRQDFETTGFANVGDALRALPIVSGTSLSSIDGGTSFTPGTNSINLRGLGNNNTLVLINGRRAAPYGSPGFNGFQVVFDFNSIPTAAIDSIEILKDGASAIYGSDAVAGVVNINLRKDFQGLNTELSIGNTSRTDSFEKKGFAIFGTSSANTSIVTTIDWSERNAIYARDLPWTDDANGASVGGFDQRSSANVIANVRGLSDRVTFPSGQATFAAPTSNPTLATAIPGNRFYNFQEDAGMFPETRFFGFYTRVTHEMTDTVSAFAEYSMRRAEVRIDSAPTPLFTVNENGNSPFGTILFPATNPYNPFGQDIIDLRWRMREVGNRINDVVTDVPRVLVGLEGQLGYSWNWEVGALYTKATTTNRNFGTVFDNLVQQGFDGVVIDGETLYLNPFGPNDPRLLDYISGENPNTDSYEIRSYDFSVSGELFDMPAGPAGFAFGGERRTEEIATVGTLANVQGLVVGGSEGANTFGDRTVYSAYAEFTAPLHKTLEVQLAARWEDYSDFGTTTKPKIAAKFRPVPQVLARVSYGESFLAPNLPFLYTSQSVSFSPQFLVDPLRPDLPAQQVKQLGGGNPDLQPEDTDVYYAGLVISPFTTKKDSVIESLTFNIDWFKFDQTNLIDSLDARTIINNLDLFGDLVVRQPPGSGETVGQIDHVITTFQNLGETIYKGFDFGVTWEHDFSRVGQIRANLSATYLDSYLFGGDSEFAGTWSQPKWRGTGTFAWTKGDWAAALYITYIGNYDQAFTAGDVEAQWLFNPQVTFKGFWDADITLGARNVFDEAPPLDQGDTTLTNVGLNIIEPLFWYLRVSRDF